jgi:hypothetical protein
MPIPALSMSYKHRLHIDRVNDGATGAQVIIYPNKHIREVVVDIVVQLIEGSNYNEHAKGPAIASSEANMPSQHNRTSSYQSDVDGAKRRSLLPQPGQARYSSYQPDTAAPKVDASVQQASHGRLRPRSMYQSGTTQPAQGKTNDQTVTSRSTRLPNTTSKPSEPQTAGLSRSRSLRKPGVSTQPAHSTLHTAHGRTQCTSNTSGLRREVSEAESSIARPRSLLGAPSSTSKSSSTPAESSLTTSRASTRVAGLSRITSVKTRSENTTSSVASHSVTRPDDPVGTHPRRREILKEEATKAVRPAFSTLQQHFTPRKTGKAPTSTFLHPAPASGVNSLPPEIISLQSELLQLHLLHQITAKVNQQWQFSAKRSLHKKFEEVASLHQAMLEFERAGREQKNLQALLAWSAESSSLGLVEYIQILSVPLHELPTLLEPGGRSERLVDEFKHWTTRVEHIWSLRINPTTNNEDLESVVGLSDSWKAENAALIRKVTSFARELDEVRQPSSGSSIALIVDTCKTLLEGLSEELQIMQAIETGVVLKEKQWVESRLQAIARDVHFYSVVTNKESAAAWRL